MLRMLPHPESTFRKEMIPVEDFKLCRNLFALDVPIRIAARCTLLP